MTQKKSEWKRNNSMPITIALTGNPNCGKTTLFNRYTGSNQYVGNWAGVTVEKKEGSVKYDGEQLTLVDLPGVYSLSPYSMEEIITRDYVIQEKPDVIIDVIDGTNIERNLYLSAQLMELDVPLVIAVNMMDEVEQKGDTIDCALLSELLGQPVVPVSARRGENTGPVLEAAIAQAKKPVAAHNVSYDQTTQNAMSAISRVLEEDENRFKLPLRFFAGKLLEGDAKAAETVKLTPDEAARVEEIVKAYEATSKYGDRETMLADARYRFVTDVCNEVVVKGQKEGSLSISDKIDLVLTNRIFAIPIFLLIMLIIFSATFGVVGEGLNNLVSFFFDELLTPAVEWILAYTKAPGWTYGLLIDAVIGGVGNVISFLPQIAILFLFLSLLEDSGYMARAAFIMDRLLRGIGLTGKSFIPMLMGFGCTTPAVMAARTMDNDRDRKLTIMILPFMSCGAKLPIYALFASVFFVNHKGLVVFSMYIIGLVIAIVSGLALKNTLFRGETAPFVMELPPYRLPTPSSLALHVWDKVRGFLIKAGTIIFSMSVLIWLLQNFDFRFQIVEDNAQSIFAALGRLIAPIFAPLGFGDWRAAVSVLAGLVAKETVVSSMAVLMHAADLGVVLTQAFTPLSAFSFMVFCLLYVPCISAFVSIKREMNSWGWALGTALFSTGVAYIVSLLIYQIGSLLLF
jgi:ferrous iron transport protein B